jgi:uncharacterized protein (DUF362 family)
MRLIIGGTDAVATDHVCALLMGKNPRHVPHLKLATEHNLGTNQYTILGCRIEDVAEDFTFIPRWRQAWGWVKLHLQPG